MLATGPSFFLLVAMLVLGLGVSTSTESSKAIDLSLERSTLHKEEGAVCASLTCHVTGNSVYVNSVTLSKVKVGGETSHLLVLTTNTPEADLVDVDNIRGNGTLQDNKAVISIDLCDMSSCELDFILCQATYTARSGEPGEAFIVAGTGKLPKFQLASQTNRENTHSIKKANSSPSKITDPYLSELWFLGEKINKVENKFETLSGQLNRRLRENIDSVQSRAGALENSVLERVSSVETDFSSRVSRLEDRVASILLSESPDTSNSDVTRTLTDLERRLDEVTERLDQMNGTNNISHESERQAEEPIECERGMGFDVSKSYPPYLTTNHQKLDRQILCDTHTDGGGWIIFQRRTKGDLDFYRNWTAYKEGFGSLSGDFWMGNEALHTLTDKHPYELRVDMIYKSKPYFAVYSSFRIENEDNKYLLRVGSVTGTADNGSRGLTYHNNMAFSTFDKDNDASSSRNCAHLQHGAWWYNDCSHCSLNGMWGEVSGSGVFWLTGSANLYPYFTELKIRRVNRSDSS